jgi:lipid A 3-O-deacylase
MRFLIYIEQLFFKFCYTPRSQPNHSKASQIALEPHFFKDLMYTKPISKPLLLAVGCILAGWQIPSMAVDSASLEFATGNKSTITRIGLQWDWANQWFKSNNTYLGGYWDLTGALIRQNRYRNLVDNTKDIGDIGITPVFRYQRNDKLGLYAEAGIGAHIFSSLYDNNGRRLSTAFQFGDHLGLGYAFSNKFDI